MKSHHFCFLNNTKESHTNAVPYTLQNTPLSYGTPSYHSTVKSNVHICVGNTFPGNTLLCTHFFYNLKNKTISLCVSMFYLPFNTANIFYNLYPWPEQSGVHIYKIMMRISTETYF